MEGKDLEKRQDGNETSTTVDSATPQTLTILFEDENPKRWPVWKKVVHTLIPALLGFTVSIGSSIWSAGMDAVSEEFHVSREVALLGLSLYSVGLAVGPIIGGSISEAIGRRNVYLISVPICLLFTMGAGLARNIGTLLVCRLFSAVAGSPALAVGAGSVADLWNMQQEGGFVTVCFMSTLSLGPAIGPLIGGYTWTDRHSWRWLMWAMLLAIGPIVIALLFQQETYFKHIQERRAKKLGITPPPESSPENKLRKALVGTVLRPFLMLVRDPIVAAWALYHSFIFGTLFGFFGSYYYVFETVYGFSVADVGLAFLGVAIGVLVAIPAYTLIERLTYLRKRRQFEETTKVPPEERLYPCMIGALILPVSLFWFAWTAREGVHWMVPITAGLPFGCSMMLLFVGGTVYLIDAYGPGLAASAVAANGFGRYTFGMAFPLFITQMYQKLGIAWATSLLAFVGCALLPIPYVLYRYGPALRARSVFIKSVQ